MQIEEGKFYFIKDEFFEYIKDKELCKNKTTGNKRPCYYCFRDYTNNSIVWFIPISSKVEKYQKIYNQKKQKHNNVDNLVFGYVEGEKRVFLIQNMFPTIEEYIIEKYIKQNRDVMVTKQLEKETDGASIDNIMIDFHTCSRISRSKSIPNMRTGITLHTKIQKKTSDIYSEATHHCHIIVVIDLQQSRA